MYIPFHALIPELSLFYQSLSKTRQLHAIISKTHLSLDPFFATRIVRFYSLNGDLASARNLFDEMPRRSVFLWNSIIRAYARDHDFKNAFSLLRRMIRSETKPDNFTFACVIRACAENEDVDGVRLGHGGIVGFGLGMDSICCSALVSGYSKLGLVDEARKVFNRVDVPDLPTWNSMISGYGYCGFCDEGVRMFNAMRSTGMEPDGYTMVALLLGLADSGLLGIGQGVHVFCLKSSLDYNAHVGSSLVSMYSRCNCLNSARKVFSSLVKPDLVTWSSLITGFSLSGDNTNALLFFREMNLEGMKPDPVLIASALSASARLGITALGHDLHGYVLRHAMETDIMVSSAIIDMYSKCGFIDSAMRFFMALPRRNVVTYNSAIMGLGSHGLASQSFWAFNQMLDTGLKPDKSTFSALLHACCYAGLVGEGKEIFKRMQDEYGLEPGTEHYVYMVKLLGMTGELKEAYKIVMSLAEPVDEDIWGALLGCCETQGDSILAENISQRIVESKPQKNRYDVMMSNVYAYGGRWDEVEKVRHGMTCSGQRKIPGISWISNIRRSDASSI